MLQVRMKKQITRAMFSSMKTARATHMTSAVSLTDNNKGSVKPLTEMPGPSGKQSLPYIGPAFLFYPFTNHRMEKVHLMFQELRDKYGKIVKFRHGMKWSVLLFDPAHIEYAMRHEGRYPERTPMPLMETYCARKGYKKGMSLLKGQEWYELRKPVQDKTMRPDIVARYIPSQSEVAEDFVNVVANKKYNTGLEQLLFRYTAETTAVFCFNSRLGFLDKADTPLSAGQEELLKSVHSFLILVAESLYTFPLFTYFPTKLYRKFERTCDVINNVGRQYVNRAIQDIEEKRTTSTFDPKEPNLLLSLLNDVRISNDKCLNVMTSFFTVTTENGSKSLAILLWLLAKNQEIQEKLFEEIKSLCGESGEIKPRTLARMPYLKACVKESHRLAFPSPLGSARVLPNEIEIDGYCIPKGTTVHFGHNILCRDPEYFDSPDEYIPERWMRECVDPAKQRILSYIVMPFGFGPRNCPGRRFAEQQLYLAVIKLLQRYRFTLQDPSQKLNLSYKIIATNDKPLRLRFEERAS